MFFNILYRFLKWDKESCENFKQTILYKAKEFFTFQIPDETKTLKDAEATYTKILAKSSNIWFFLLESLPTLCKTMLWKHFQIFMYSFIKNWYINLTIWHIVLRFHP